MLTRCLLTLAAPMSVALAQTRSIDLTGKPDASIKEPFSILAGVREIPGGQAIAVDQMEHAIYLADFFRGSLTKIGSQGDGPGEYRFPMAPLAGPANVTWVPDGSQHRTHVVTPDGKIASSLTPPEAGQPGGLVAARGVDRDGRIYFEGNSFNPERGSFADSVAIVRWNPKDNRADAIARFWSGGRVIIQGRGGPASLARQITPYPHLDGWTVLPDGRVAIVLHDPFRIDFVETNGTVTHGPAIPNSPIALTAAERDDYREKHSATRMTAGGRAGGPIMMGPQFEDAQFPKTLPPFVWDAVRATPEGELWIGRSFGAKDKTWRYDIFDARGTRVGAATLKTGSRIVGFGPGTVYVARTDPSDDLVYLERYRR